MGCPSLPVWCVRNRTRVEEKDLFTFFFSKQIKMREWVVDANLPSKRKTRSFRDSAGGAAHDGAAVSDRESALRQ